MGPNPVTIKVSESEITSTRTFTSRDITDPTFGPIPIDFQPPTSKSLVGQGSRIEMRTPQQGPHIAHVDESRSNVAWPKDPPGGIH